MVFVGNIVIFDFTESNDLYLLRISEMRIFLLGYMGCGKSTVGKRLAKRLNIPFFDLDKYIENTTNKSISDIFEKEGEAAFRGMERKYLKELVLANETFLIATGGGTPCFYDNLKFMVEHGTTIYLKMDVASLTYRLLHAKEQRPLIKGKSEEELSAFVKQHLEERKEYYEQTHFIVNAIGFGSHKLNVVAETLLNQASK